MHTSDTWVQLNNSEIIRFKFMHVFFIDCAIVQILAQVHLNQLQQIANELLALSFSTSHRTLV